MMNDQDLRKFAREGALQVALRIVTEFPDILAELNVVARSGATRVESIKRGREIDLPMEVRRREDPRKSLGLAARKPWSDARRKAQAARMRKHWAGKRKQK